MGTEDLFREISGSYRSRPHEDLVFVYPGRQAKRVEGPTTYLRFPFSQKRVYAIDTREKRLDVSTEGITSDDQLIDDIAGFLKYLVADPEKAIRTLLPDYKDELTRFLQTEIRTAVISFDRQSLEPRKLDIEAFVLRDSGVYAARWGLKPVYFGFERLGEKISSELSEVDRERIISKVRDVRGRLEADLKYLRTLQETIDLEGSGVRRPKVEAQPQSRAGSSEYLEPRPRRPEPETQSGATLASESAPGPEKSKKDAPGKTEGNFLARLPFVGDLFNNKVIGED